MKLKILATILFVMLLSAGSFAQKRHGGGGRSKGGHGKAGGHARKAVHPHKHSADKKTTQLPANKRKKP